jgi:hypothetical protein
VPNYLDIGHRIKRASAEVAPRLQCIVFVRGRFGAHDAALERLWRALQDGWLDQRLTRYRTGAQTGWSAVPRASSFAALLGAPADAPGTRSVELTDGDDAGIWRFIDAAPVRDAERASLIHIRFADGTSAAHIAQFGDWLVNRLPFWWATAGYVFEHTSGGYFTACARMAALAKRHWAVQILDTATWQWDALAGMPPPGWLSLVGAAFARAAGCDIHRLEGDAAALVARKVYHRSGPFGLAIAAGAQPVTGDINIGEDIDAYLHAARLFEPLTLADATPLSGPLADPDVLRAWTRRFADPRGWMECDVAVK